MDLYCMELSGFPISIPDNLFIYFTQILKESNR